MAGYNKNMSKEFTKIINPATVGDNENQAYGVYIKMEYKQKNNDPKKLCLSISGVIGPKSNGDCAGACGQMIDSVLDYDFINWKTGFNLETYQKFISIWKRWHLNDLNPGCEHQRAENWGNKKVIIDGEEKITNWLTQEEHPEGVLSKPCPVCGYKYGSAWLFEEVPAEVIDWLQSLPSTQLTPAWV